MHIPFFNIITYFFNIVKPVGPHFTGNYNAYGRPLELGKKSHMVGPVGNTELGGRWRRVHHLQVAYEEAIASSSHFRETVRAYEAARSGKIFAYGALRSEIRARTAVHGPLNTAQKRKEGRLPASLIICLLLHTPRIVRMILVQVCQ